MDQSVTKFFTIIDICSAFKISIDMYTCTHLFSLGKKSAVYLEYYASRTYEVLFYFFQVLYQTLKCSDPKYWWLLLMYHWSGQFNTNSIPLLTNGYKASQKNKKAPMFSNNSLLPQASSIIDEEHYLKRYHILVKNIQAEPTLYYKSGYQMFLCQQGPFYF